MLLRVLADVVTRHDAAAAASLLDGTASRFTACEPVDVRLPLSEYRRLLERAIRLTGDPALGLHMGSCASDSAFDLMAPLVAHVPTLRHALSEAIRFAPLVLDGAYMHLSEHSASVRLRLELPNAHELTDRCLAEFSAASLMRLLRAFGCARADVETVRFEHGRPAHHRAYAAVFEGAERFSEHFTGIEFSARLLDRPNLHSNPVLQTLIRGQAEERLCRRSRSHSAVDRLRTYLLNQPTARVPDMRVAARDLGTSVRSLRRRLTEEGGSYRELTQEIQCEQACAMLRKREVPLQQIADALGFADMATFHRAFKRWTGVTASEYRLKH